MLRNVWSKSSSEWDTKQSRKEDPCCKSNLNSTADHNKNVPGAVNRDSGIFEDFSSFASVSTEEEEDEDYFIPDIDLNEKDKEDYFQLDIDISEEDYLQPGVFLTEEDKSNYFFHETDHCSDYEVNSSDEEELSSCCDTDRELHASLSSLDTAVASTSLSISLSSLTTSTEEEEEEEEEGASDFDLSSSDSDDDLSEDSSEEDQENSNSFGYHSLLNDLSPEDDVNSDIDPHELKLAKNDDDLLDAEVSSLTYFTEKSHALVITSISPALSFYDNHPFVPHSHCETFSDCSSSFRSSDISSSAESSEDESPSDIELKMAETEVKMCDALLSSGREELGFRSKIHLNSAEIRMDTNTLPQEIHANDFKLPNNNLDENYHQYPVDDNEKSSERQDMNLSLKSNSRDNSSWRDNKYSSSSVESPIIDAYEKECRDAPEKLVKEFENKERELENKQRLLKNKQQELENELQELENKQQALYDKKKQESEERIADTLSEMDIEHDQDLLAFEAVMEAAIKNKEAKSFDTPLMHLDLTEDLMRHRPCPKQRRRERNALRRSDPSQTTGNNGVGSPEAGEFDVYNMETAIPTIDWEAMEELFRASQEEDEKRKRTDREEIRKKLAMETDDDDYQHIRKPSLHSRLQNGKNLQICFMNETASDCESQCSDTESTEDRTDELDSSKNSKTKEPKNFLSHQARLQEDARMALGQAKEMARMQMHLEKQSQNKSPITEIVRGSFNKIGFPCPDNKRRMSRQVLSDMNVAQLQIIVNEFHTQIENLNEVLVQLLLQRDDLHMEQDSMLVDIEDLNKHQGAKEGCILLKPDPKSSKSNRRFTKSSKLRPFINK